ncbi:MAG: DUF29 domain-containing protein [Roseiarcus sp.]
MGRSAASKTGERAVSKAEDIYAWATTQAALLRAHKLDEIDAEAIAEEIDDVGEEQYLRLESALRVLMHHLLKWQYQPTMRSRSWALTVRERRRRVDRQLRKTPSLKSRLAEAFADAYEDARDDAARETGLPLGVLPKAPPFDFAEALARPIVWPGDEG